MTRFFLADRPLGFIARPKFRKVTMTPIMENQMEKKMENEMETREYMGIIRV